MTTLSQSRNIHILRVSLRYLLLAVSITAATIWTIDLVVKFLIANEPDAPTRTLSAEVTRNIQMVLALLPGNLIGVLSLVRIFQRRDYRGYRDVLLAIGVGVLMSVISCVSVGFYEMVVARVPLGNGLYEYPPVTPISFPIFGGIVGISVGILGAPYWLVGTYFLSRTNAYIGTVQEKPTQTGHDI